MKKFVILLLCLSPFIGNAQGSKIGVRAGLNYSWIQGPLETGENFSSSGGFHFGINYSYYFSRYFGLRAEILYNQKGTEQTLLGDSYYILRRSNERLVDYGTADYKLEDSNGYVSLPISASLQLTRKFELYGGVSLDFLVGPSGTGRLDYESTAFPEGIFFIQSFDNDYYSDCAACTSTFSSSTIALIVEGERLDIPRTAAAYYFFNEKDGNKYNWFDTSLHFGMNYFLNTGFYVGANINYGLFDLTRTEMDVSLIELNEFESFSDDSFIRRDDSDHQISIQASLGFRF